MGLETERERFGGFQDFLGKNLLQATALLSLESPTAPFIYASNPRSGQSGFALDANHVPGMTYSLWQTVSLEAGNWQPVLDAVTTVDGFTVTLIDTNAAQSRISIKFR